MVESKRKDASSEEARRQREVSTVQSDGSIPVLQEDAVGRTQTRPSDVDGDNDARETHSKSVSSSPLAENAVRAMRDGVDKVREGADQLIAKSRNLSFHPPEWVLQPFRRQEKFTPRADFAMLDDGYEITMELAGVDPKSINVKLVDGKITVSGTKAHSDLSVAATGYFIQERHFGNFERSFQIPHDVNPEKIDSHFAEHILSIRLQKYPITVAPNREIEVR